MIDKKNESPNDAKPLLGVVFILFETDDSHGDKGVCGVFDSKLKAEQAQKIKCGNDKWCSIIVEEWSVK